MYTAVHMVRQVHVLFSPFHFLFSILSADNHFRTLKINGSETGKILTAERNYFTKSCFSEQCTPFTEQ